jgi:lipoprotein-anchoring transpeptidase ErfK/SrfK
MKWLAPLATLAVAAVPAAVAGPAAAAFSLRSRSSRRRKSAVVGEPAISMNGYPHTVLKLLVAAVVALAFPTAALAVSQSPPKPVIGSGTINVPTLLVRSAPSGRARVIAKLSEFRPQDYRPRYALAVAMKRGKKGKPAWYKITVPGRPNGRTGWVAAKQVTIRSVPWQVVVFRGSRVMQLWKKDQLVYTSKVAVGAPGMETPIGLYYVTVRFRPVTEPFLGTFAFETSAYSKLSEWPGGGVVGLHGTTSPQLLGQAVSHGCIRISNETADFLRDRIPLGTPIRVLAS